MANKDDSFLSKHGDKINAAGHAINTLQNAKIAERQRKIAQLQVATAKLQQEENELKKKELQMLQKQQKALEEEQRRARQEQKQKEELKAELLDVSPKLNRFLDEILQADYVDGFERGRDLYEASSALAYLNEHKGIIEDINFHEYLYQIHEKLNKSINKFRSDFDSFNNYLKEFYAFIETHNQYFEVILIMLGAKKAEVTQRAEIDQYEKTIQDLISKNELTSSLRASLKKYKEVFLSKDFRFDDRFVPPPIQRNEYNLILNFLGSILSDEFNKELIEYRMKEIRTGYYVFSCISYLKESKSSIKELKSKLDLIEIDNCTEDEIKELRSEIGKFVKKIKSNFINVENRIGIDKTSGKIKLYKSNLKKIEGISGISLDSHIDGNEINKSETDEISGFLIASALIGILGAIVFLILSIVSSTNNSGNTGTYLIFMIVCLIPLMIFGITSSYKENNTKQKLKDARSGYIKAITEALKPIENWGR